MTEPGWDKVKRLAAAENGLCTLAAVDANGAPHVSVVNSGPWAHPVTGADVVATVVRANAAKLRLLRSGGPAAILFRHSWDWVAVHGTPTVLGPLDPLDGVDPAAIPQFLREVFACAGGDHDDWDAFDRVMAAEQRSIVMMSVDRVVANSGSIT